MSIKKILLIIFLGLSFAVRCFDINQKIDSKGFVSPDGKYLSQWLEFIRQYPSRRGGYVVSQDGRNKRFKDWDQIRFYENHRSFVQWEITKTLKRRMFKLGFFPEYYLRPNNVTDVCISFWMDFPPEKNKSNAILILYNVFGSWGNDTKSKALFLLKSFGECAREEHKFLLNKMNQDRNRIREYKALGFVISANTEQAKDINDYLKRFEKSYIGPNTNSHIYHSFVQKWDEKTIIRRLLDEQKINNRNKGAFYDLLARLNGDLPEDIIDKIIRYWGLDGGNGVLTLDANLACARIYNPKLRQAILNNLNSIIPPKDFIYADDRAVQVYLKGTKEALKQIHTREKLVLSYARLTGDSNKAFDLAYEIVDRLNQRYRNRTKGELPRLQMMISSSLIFENGSLNDENAGKIIALLTAKLSGFRHGYNSPLKLHSRYAKLLTVDDLARNPVATRNLACCADQKALNRALLEALVKDENYMKRHNNAYKKAIQVLNPNKLPVAVASENKIQEYIEKLKNNPTEESVREICSRLKRWGIYALPAAPLLRPYVTKENIDFATKIYVIVALAEMGDKESIPLIKKYVENKNKLLEKAARQALFLLYDINVKNDYFDEMLQIQLRGYW